MSGSFKYVIAFYHIVMYYSMYKCRTGNVNILDVLLFRPNSKRDEELVIFNS